MLDDLRELFDSFLGVCLGIGFIIWITLSGIAQFINMDNQHQQMMAMQGLCYMQTPGTEGGRTYLPCMEGTSVEPLTSNGTSEVSKPSFILNGTSGSIPVYTGYSTPK